jgi:hypothetical protein
MPRDVRTRWNSTFDMLNFAVEYQTALDQLTGERASNLRQYEMGPDEWRTARQLRDVLQVSIEPIAGRALRLTVYTLYTGF